MLRSWLARLSEKDNVQALVQDALGCACPSTVFDHFQVQYMQGDPVPFIQIIVGNRLLLHLMHPDSTMLSQELILDLLKKGRNERDRRGLNRFRLVLVGSHISPRKEWEEELSSLKDSKVHLHFLPEFPLD
ncbi:MAG: hypothetical protein DRG63_11210 [Deltaproteobacteria bacterium]|nr:MAG: hypothetical protein DRG63_11210 [Deltaproteobacteria bacterium]